MHAECTSNNGHARIFEMLADAVQEQTEVLSLRWSDLQLDAPCPHILLRASETKSKRGDTLPLRSDLVQDLRKRYQETEDVEPTDRIFKRVPRIYEHRRWLEAAGIPYIDATGRRVDLHALRHTFGTLLSRSGVLPREAMSLMRHTDMRLTMNVYTDPRIFDLAGAVEKLPALLPTPADPSNPLPDVAAAPNSVSGVTNDKWREIGSTPAAKLGDCTALSDTKVENDDMRNHSEKPEEKARLAGGDFENREERAKGVEPSTLGLESPHSAN